MIKTVDRDKLFIIAVDGLDVSGKETFCRNLTKVLDDIIRSKYLMNATVTSVAFPRYETTYGIQIREILRTPLEDRDVEKLENLFSEDRIDFFNTFAKEKYEENRMNIIVCDRYAYANLIFQHLNFINETDPVARACASLAVKDRFMREFKNIPKPDITLIFNRMDEDSSKLHDELITKKEDKDLNESIEIQKYLSNIINSELTPIIADTCKTLITVPIGSTFGTSSSYNKLEEAVAVEAMLKMESLGMSRVIYPAVRYVKNGLSAKMLGDAKVQPTVKIVTEPTEESKEIIKFLIDVYIKPSIDSYNKHLTNWMASGVKKLESTYYRILNATSEINDQRKHKGYQFINDNFLNSIVGHLHLLFDYNNNGLITGMKDDLKLSDELSKRLFTPYKDSELASPYTILAPAEYKLCAGEIKEVSLLVNINTIEGLVRDTQNKIIDIDIKTNRDCVLNYGVVIADSPSSLSCDFTGELKVVLINHKNEDVIIPIGSKIASMMIKRSSCVTEFKIENK